MRIYYFVSDVIRTIDSVKEPVMKEVESHENLNITQLRKKREIIRLCIVNTFAKVT